MKRAWLALLFVLSPAAYGQVTNPFTLYVHDTTGTLPDTPLPAIYQLASTPVGSNTVTVIKMINTSSNTVYFVTALMSTSATSPEKNPNFSVTGVFEDQPLAPGASVLYTINFTPTGTGVVTGYLNLAFQVEQGGCVLSGSTGTVCPANLLNVSTLNGTATAPQLTLSYQTAAGPVVLTPASSSPLNFPNTSLSSTSTITFTLANPTTVSTATPAISLPVINTNEPSAFSLDVSAVPATIAAGQSASFNVTFAPSQNSLDSGALQVGSNTYPIQGEGIIVATIDTLQISYTDSTGIRVLPQAATPISFGQVIPGSGGIVVLTFNVANPSTSYNAVTVPAITISGTSYSLTGVTAAPIVISPGNSITFQASFTPPSTGVYAGSLSIGSRTFSLNGNGVTAPSPVLGSTPAVSLTFGSPLSSQQQATVTVQLNSPATGTANTILELSMQFAPAAGAPNEPAIVFTKTGGSSLQLTVIPGSQTATFEGVSAIAFQTGTTWGAITFSITYLGSTIYKQSFAIQPELVQIKTATATRETSYLLVSVTGFDNTFSASQLSFTFYDTTGNIIGSPISYNASSDFQDFFSTIGQSGGVFTLNATFPVLTGDITKVGSVTVGVTNSVGQSTTSVAFQ